MRHDLKAYLPTTKKELQLRGWDEVDVILFSGDAYIDHPSFGAAVIGRVLEANGYRVAIVPQPDWRGDHRDFTKLGRPRLFFAVTSGSMDSMVNHYTAAKRLRSDDAYTPEGKAGMRPDYCTITYCNILKQLYPDVPIVIGGFATTIYCIDWNNRGYQRFQKAYRLLSEYEANPDPTLYPNGSPDEFAGRYNTSFLKNLRNSYRRNRDLCIILTAGLYILQAVDAHVDAHLQSYDISKDLSVSLTPAIGYSYNRMAPYSGGGTTLGMNLGITF